MARWHAIDPIDPELVVEVKKGPDVVHENHAKLYHTSTRENEWKWWSHSEGLYQNIKIV